MIAKNARFDNPGLGGVYWLVEFIKRLVLATSYFPLKEYHRRYHVSLPCSE